AFWNDKGSAKGIASNFLIARPSLVSAEDIANPSDWGTFEIGAPAAGDLVVKSTNGSTCLPSWPVPLAKFPPAMDGGMRGWEAVPFQVSRYLGALWTDRFASWSAALYDADNLYLKIHVPSQGPWNLMVESAQKGIEGGDALQIRLSNGTKKVT